MEFLIEYGMFLAKAVTIVASIGIVVGLIVSSGMQSKKQPEGHIEVTKLNEEYDDWQDQLKSELLSDDALKAEQKAEKKKQKAEKKAKKKTDEVANKKRVFVLDFDGDIKASAVENMRHEISAVLTMAKESDEVVIRLESGGGMVHSYGLASSQLQRIRDRNIPLTVTVDKVAASGGYMMACIANNIVAAPFAIIGSIGVVAQLPNFHKLLKKNDIDFEIHTAGEYKRTLTMFGENTDNGREKFREELEDTHVLFKEFVGEHRPELDVAAVATGEVWYGSRAKAINLVDEISTSDDYLMRQRDSAEIYKIVFEHKKSLQEKLGFAAETAVDTAISKWLSRLQNARFW